MLPQSRSPRVDEYLNEGSKTSAPAVPQSRSPRVDEYLNEGSKTSAPAVPQSQSGWVLKSKLVSAHRLLVSVHGLKNEVYSYCSAKTAGLREQH